MHKSKLKGVTLAVLLAFMPLAADAAGLGRLTVTSGLGEPLSAEIELLSTTAEELESLTAGIAPQEAYNVQGVERAAIHNAIKVAVSKRADGVPVLKLTSAQAISDPFLDMLIQVDWATGRLLREYTVLLDPPGYSNQAQVYNGVQLPPTATPSIPAQPPVATAAQTAPPVKATPQQRTPAPSPVKNTSAAPAAIASNSSTQQAYTTSQGDTLSAIAREHQVQGVSLDQMLVGLYRANEDAFAGKNMNRLKVGQILRVPDVSELQQVTPGEAAREIRVQAADWNAYRNRLADLAANAEPSTGGGESQSASGRISSAATDRAVPAATGPRDVVKLSSGNANQAQLNALQEELTVKDRSLKESAERTALLEKQIADMQKLLAIKNQALANLQNAEQPPVKPVEVPLPPAAESEPQAEPQAETPEVVEPAELDNAVEVPPAEDAAQAAKPAPVVETTPVEEPSLVDELLGDDPLPLALAGGGIVLLLGGWLYMRNRRKRELDSFEKGILTAGGLKPNTVFGNTAGATVNTGDTSFLNDFSQNTGGMIDTHDVDPIAEAEVYMAYGRDAQAEEILKDAIVKEPQRHELHLKLLEIYASRNDTSAFETVAGEIYTTLGASDPIWSKVAAMGRKLEPENPLYSPDNESRPLTVNAAESVSETSLSAGAAVVAGGALAGAASVAASPVMEDEPQSNVEEFLDESVIDDVEDRDLPDLDFDFTTVEQIADVADSDADDVLHADNSLDFTLDLPEPPAKDSVQLDIAELDADIPDFDLPDLSADDQLVDVGAEQDPVPELFIPEIDALDSAVSTTESSSEAPIADMDVPELSLPEIELPAPADESNASSLSVENDGLPDIDFDLPEISFDEDAVDSVSHEAENIAKGELGTLDNLPEIQLDNAQQGASGVDFSSIDLGQDSHSPLDNGATVDALELPEFDLDIDEPDMPASTAADIDLSGISLDVADEPAGLNTLDDSISLEESADVDTKLDLVTAYMDMGDNEGARELLEEILKEGGPRQRQKAQEILDNLP